MTGRVLSKSPAVRSTSALARLGVPGLLAMAVLGPGMAHAAPAPAQSCTATQTRSGVFGDTVAQTFFTPRGAVTGFDVNLGFARAWKGSLTGRVVRILAGPAGPYQVKTETLAEVGRAVSGKAYTTQWVHFQLAEPVDVAGVDEALGALAIELVGLPAPVDGRAVAAWMLCAEDYPYGRLQATNNVFLPGMTVATPLQSPLAFDGLFRIYAT